MRLIPVESVEEGTYLAKTIFDDNGRALLREGVKLTPLLINSIKKVNIRSIYINDEYSEGRIEDLIKPELRQKALSTIKSTFYSFEKYNLYSEKTPENQKAHMREKQEYFKSIGDIADQVVEEILSNKNVMINMVDIKSLDNYTYQHCVNVAVLSLVLGIQIGLNRDELMNLCMGALVHDIGKTLIPRSILEKRGKLTEKEFEIVKEHTTRGYDYLKDGVELTAPSRIIALQHHERENGRGYPEGRKSKNINRFAKIVAIADVYDALTSDRPYRKAMCPNDAVEYIMANGQNLFDYKMVKAFSKAVVPYPEGTLVRLSNGQIAVVEEVYPNYILRPKVRIIDTQSKKLTEEVIDLRTNLSVVIEGIKYKIE